MKARRLAAALAAASLAWAGVAGAQMMGPGGGMGPSMGFFSNGLARSPYIGPIDMRNVGASWLGGLHDALAITPAQEAAWLAFANAVTDQAADMQAFRTQMLQPATGTAPQRAALAEQFMAQRLESMGAVSASMSALYDALTPDQRAIVDRAYAAACWPGGLFGG